MTTLFTSPTVSGRPEIKAGPLRQIQPLPSALAATGSGTRDNAARWDAMSARPLAPLGTGGGTLLTSAFPDGCPPLAELGPTDRHLPHAARVQDYLLGGACNFGADRAFARQLVQVMPDARVDVWAARAFVHRAVAYLRSRGIRQFVDLGSGLPAGGSVHELAPSLDPFCRAVYVDADPVVTAYIRRAVGGVREAGVVEADLRSVDEVLGRASEVLDLREPVGLIAAGVLQFVPDWNDPAALLAAYGAALAPGCFLVLAHATSEGLTFAQAVAACGLYESAGASLVLRSPADVSALVDGWDFVPAVAATDHEASACPEVQGTTTGLLPVSDWRPDAVQGGPRTIRIYGGVGMVKPSGGQATPVPAATRAADVATRSDDNAAPGLLPVASPSCPAALSPKVQRLTDGGAR
ncbi:SAM-dependent methyltransferase [Cryptosporangium sp. NPDC048952]|uniref:SAM-dependent methyltransferase n=1 Tax=Cryptosporangium sp. NPDC048952 TaxID=3363961 RepID=UPI00371F79ED